MFAAGTSGKNCASPPFAACLRFEFRIWKYTDESPKACRSYSMLPNADQRSDGDQMWPSSPKNALFQGAASKSTSQE